MDFLKLILQELCLVMVITICIHIFKTALTFVLEVLKIVRNYDYLSLISSFVFSLPKSRTLFQEPSGPKKELQISSGSAVSSQEDEDLKAQLGRGGLAPQFCLPERSLLGYWNLLQLILNVHFYLSLVLILYMHSSPGTTVRGADQAELRFGYSLLQ